jgi:WD40 repeat protein/class 3 adenylate cyclase
MLTLCGKARAWIEHSPGDDALTSPDRDATIAATSSEQGDHPMETGAVETGPAVRTFLIADVRGYTRFTREHGDAAAARLAKRFADLARDAVEARRGRVIELRGDEALAVFDSTAQAVRAAVEFQAICAEDTAADPAVPLTVGIGIDVGEAIPVEDGFRGVALNTAARLCSRALAGQILVTRAVADAAADVDGVSLEEVGPADLKGFETPVDVIAVVSTRAPLADVRRVPPTELPPELDPLTPLVGREHEMHWLRGTWRQARRGRGRVVVVSGPSQIGKTRLVSELASEVADGGGDVVYAGAGGAALALALAAIRRATAATEATLVVLDDLDVVGEEAALALADGHDAIADRSVMVVATVKDPAAGPGLASAMQVADRSGDGHLPLPALALEGAQGIARLYVGEDLEHVPLESMVRASGGLPGRLHEVVSEWTRDEAGRRLAAAAEWLAQGRDRRSADLEFANNAIGLGLARLYATPPSVAGEAECPYKGLASFEESDAASFFGRERLVGELAARTVHVGLLGVVGASGSGKSSVVAGGLFPSLRAGLLPGSERWRTVRFRPGERPMAELERAVGGTLADAIDATGPDGRLVVAVDQFEEVFTLSAAEERARFISTLTDAVRTSPDRVVVVLTIRDDFYGHCAPYLDLAELLVANQVLVPPMTVEELRRAIELPARRARLRVEADLVDALVAEVADEPGGLPLLSAALVELWQAREDGWLRMNAYERTGGVRGAVAGLAEASFDQLTPEERDVARRLFLRLASVGDGDVVTRRRVDLVELEVETDPVAASVADRLTTDRLLVSTGSSVEVAHEALLREWPRLRSWLDDDLQGHRLRQHITHAAQQWDAADRDPSEVYRGARLSAALDWASTHGADLNELERAFLAESREASERDVERQRRTNRRLRGLLVGTAVFLVIALVAGGLALVQRGRARSEADRAEREAVRAEREAGIATARELAGASVANLDVDPELALLLAIKAADATSGVEGIVLPEAEEALHRAVLTRLVGNVPQGSNVAVAPDGTRFATAGPTGGTVWDMETHERLSDISGHDPDLIGVTFDPTGDLIATTGVDGRLRLWDATSGDLVDVLRVRDTAIWGVAFDPEGKRVAATVDDGTVRVWDVASGRQLDVLRGPKEHPFRSPAWPLAPAFSPDGTLVASGGWGYVGTVWDLATGRVAATLEGHVWEVSALGFSSDGAVLATTGPDGMVRLWDVATWDATRTFTGANADQRTLAWSADGSRIATGGADGTAVVWDATTGAQLMQLAGHSAEIFGVAFSPDGSTLLTSSMDATTRLWDVTLEGEREWLTVPGPELRLGGVAFSPDGSTFAVPMQESGVRIHDTETGEILMELTGHEAPLWDFSFSPDGRLLAGSPGAGPPNAEGDARTVPIWDLSTGDLVAVLDGHEKEATAVEFDPSGERVVTASYDGVLRVWRVGRWDEPIQELSVGTATYGLAFSPDGRLLLASFGGSGAVSVLDGTTLERTGRLTGHDDYIQHIALLGADHAVSASADGTAIVWDLGASEAIATLGAHTGAVLNVAVAPDGALIATAGYDGVAKLWDAKTGDELMTLYGHDRIVHSVAFSPDGRFLATASGDGTVMLRLLPIDELRELAAERVTRELTDQECERYLHVSRCPST